MNHRINLFLPLFSILLLLILQGCSENNFITEIDVQSTVKDPKLAISARYIQSVPPDKDLIVFVTGSRGINQAADIEEVKDAEVSLWEEGVQVDTGIWVDTIRVSPFTRDRISGYVVKWKDFVAGKQYTLKVAASGYPSVESTVTMPWKSEVDDPKYNVDAFGSSQISIKANELEFDLPSNQAGDYYYAVPKVAFVNGIPPNRDTSVTELFPIPENELYQESGFSGIIFRGKDLLPFESKVKIAVDDYGPLGENKYYLLDLYHITQDQYSFLLSYEEYRRASGNPFAEPVAVYSNISNGLGIFSLEYLQTIHFQ